MKNSKKNNKLKGDYGEKLAMEYLNDNDYIIIERNFRNRIGEIDIIAKKDNIIVFIEVKSRKNSKYGYGYEAVNKRKQDKIIKLANSYINFKNLRSFQFRFDIIEVYFEDCRINHIENAFWV
ncbi:YraN family protein [Sporosalibacterium faouarense]|uniref:YraN family protein n=1 Tax=Sporosalibacterium faouarense TaxID=516123 RepID=UPI00192C44DF|nr:YraN family protein [Sporosalibacterium faouarense]